MMTKVFSFEDNGWWDNPTCDCCQGGYYETYNCDQIEGSCYNIDDCYIAAIAHATQMPYDEQEKLEWLSSEELEELAKVLDIKVVFVE